MRRGFKRPSLAWALAALAALVLAAGIRFISNAHGHGLASPDRTAIGLLLAVAVGCAALSIWTLLSRDR